MGNIACYCRVSTQEQNLDRQLAATKDYALTRLDAVPSDLELYRDKSTGTNTARNAYLRLMNDVEAGEVEVVITHEISRVARSIRDLERTVDRLHEHGVSLHIVSEGLVIEADESDPFQKAMYRLLGVFAQLEAEMGQQRTREGIAVRMSDPEYHHGPAPFGFTKADGYLVEAENYDQVVTVLDLVMSGDLSKRKAANELGCSRATVRNALDRRELYGL